LGLKRTIRNIAGYLLAITIILRGHLKHSKQKALQQDVITSICFHNPHKKLFRKLTLWLKKNGFVFLSSSQLIEILKKQAPCPRGAVWLSIDDGWRDNLKNVIPLAVKCNIPITIFVYTGAVEEGAFWWRKTVQFPNLISPEYRGVNILKSQPEEVRARIIRKIDQAGISYEREAITIEELKNISAIPQITIGAHTITHPILPNCTLKQLKEEIVESKRKLEEWTDKSVTVFAYPNGSFNGRERPVLKRHGYELAATIEEIPADINSDPYLFPRNIVMDDGSFPENLCHALGIWAPFIKRIKRNVI